MSLSVDFSKWHVRRGIGELSRIYHFSGLQVPGATATLRLDCRLESSVRGFIYSNLTLYLRPFRLLHETSLVMGLVTADPSKGGIVEVRACPVEGDPDTALLAVGLGVEDRQDVQKCLSAISSGKEMFFMLGNQTRPIVKLALPNDGEFQRLYNETYKRMARAQDPSKVGLYLKRFLRGVGTRLGAASTRQGSFAVACKHGRRILAKTALDTFTGLKAATLGLTKGYSFPDKSNARAERLKARRWARAVAPAQDVSRDGLYLKRFLRGVGARLGAATTRQRTDVTFTAAFKHGWRLLAKTALDTFTRLKAATLGLTKGYSFPDKISAMAERIKARTWAPVAPAQDASRDGLYLKRFLRGVGTRIGAATTRQQTDVTFTAAFKHGWRLLAQTALDTFTGLKAATLGLTKGYSFPDKISAMAERIKARTWAPVAPAQDASRDGLYLKRFLHGIGTRLGAATTRQGSFRAAFKHGRRLLAKADEPIVPDAVRWPTSPSSQRPFRDTAASGIPLNGVKWVEAHRGWAVFGVSAFAGVVVLFALIGSPSIQSTSSTKPLSNSGASPAGPVQAAVNVKMQAETAANPSGLFDAANKELPKQEQTPVPAEVRPVTHPIGEVGTLKQAFVGCRDSWQDDGLLKLESKLTANECDVRLPAGTEVIVANIRANNNICVRFPDDTVCYWATGDVLKPSKLVPPTATEVHPIKARPAKAHPAIRRREDDRLNFLR